MSETDNTAAQDLASLKLPELRKMAAERGLRGVSALRKGDLITAIKTGQVPPKAKAKVEKAARVEKAEKAEKSDKPEKPRAQAQDDAPQKAEKQEESGEKQDNRQQNSGDEQRLSLIHI